MAGPIDPTAYPASYPQRLSQLCRDDLWCRIQSGSPRHVETDPVEDLTESDEITLLIDRVAALSRIFPDASRTPADVVTGATPLTAARRDRQRLLAMPHVADQAREIHQLFADYDALCKAEYDRIKNPRNVEEFSGLADKRTMEPWQYYKWLRKFYFRRGIGNVPERINLIVPGQRFLGRNVGGAHPDLAEILRDTERNLVGWGRRTEVAAAITSAYCFVPRPKNNLVGLSPHALGRAIDINAGRNPHLQGEQATAIDAILNWMQTRGEGTASRVKRKIETVKDYSQTTEDEMFDLVATMQEISNTLRVFLARYLEDWVEQRSSGTVAEQEATPLLETFLKAAKVFRTSSSGTRIVDATKLAEARRMSREGIIELPVALFQAFSLAKAKSGIEFENAKDTMHFEAIPAIQEGPTPPCLTTARR